MSDYISKWDLVDINAGVQGMRDGLSSREKMFVIIETSSSTSGNPIEPVFGEPLDPFASGSVTTSASYFGFEGRVGYLNSVSDFNEAGFNDVVRVSVDIPAHCFDGSGVTLTAGLLVMLNGSRFRVTDVDDRGMVPYNRTVIFMDMVT